MKTFPLLAAAAALAAAGAVAPAQARVVVGIDVPLVAVAPPYAPPAYVEVAPAPRPGYYWNHGYQNWNGTGYAWVGGSWGRPGGNGRVWANPGWRREGGGWRWRQGRWN